MANRSYLVTSNVDTVNPSAVDPGFDPKLQTVAAGCNCVPLIWFGLFRDHELRTQQFDRNGEQFSLTAPITLIETAIPQLRHAAAVFTRLFPGTDFADDAKLLAEAVTGTGHRYVSIELEEIAWMDEAGKCDNDCRVALATLAGKERLPVGWGKFFSLSGIDPRSVLPPPRCLLGPPPAKDEDVETHAKVIGSSWIRPVPWEPS